MSVHLVKRKGNEGKHETTTEAKTEARCENYVKIRAFESNIGQAVFRVVAIPASSHQPRLW